MAPLTFGALVFAAVLATACDLSQKKPETSAGVFHSGDAAGRPHDAARGERSIRLFGPGVSRQRQIRV